MENRYTKEKVSSFQDRFKELCDAKSTTDTALADKLGVSKQTISSWKSGYRSPKRPMVENIARLFGVNTDWLMGYDFPRFPQKRLYVTDESPVRPAGKLHIRQPFSKSVIRAIAAKNPTDAKGAEELKVIGNMAPSHQLEFTAKDEKAVKIVRFIGQMAKEDPESALEILKVMADKDMI